MSRLTANFLLLLAGLVWGLGFVAQESAMQHIGPFQFVGFRFLAATLVVLPFALRERHKLLTDGTFVPFSKKQKISLGLTGIVFFIMMITQQIGLLATTVTNAGMLTGIYVIFVPVIALLFLHERQPTIIWPMAGLALLGIWFLGGGGFDNFTWGDALVVFSAVFAALQVIMVGKVSGSIGRPIALAVSQFAVCGILGMFGYGIAQIWNWSLEPAFSGATLLSAAPEIAYAAVFAGGLAFTLQAIAQRHTRAADAAILLSSEALFAAIGGALLLGERLDMMGYLGCALLFIAIATISIISTKSASKADS